MVNEVLYTHGIAQTPWGGVKQSGLGRTHGRLGLLELVTPQHVQSLIYYNGPRGMRLIGAMYIMPGRGLDGPQIGGPLTQWHQHSNICFDDTTAMAVAFVHSDVFDGNNGKSGSCPRGSTNKTTPLMLHVWLIDNPDGPFAADMEPAVLGTAAPIS